MKTMFGYPQLVPPEIDIAHISKVIDLATGTGAWVLDFASLPDVRDRNIQVFACDISTEKFPQAEEQGTNKINFFQHDITEPFPDELLETFDLVNVAFLCFALTEQGWKSALQNIYQLLSK
jgi:SAM-dependent methyltransferase